MGAAETVRIDVIVKKFFEEGPDDLVSGFALSLRERDAERWHMIDAAKRRRLDLGNWGSLVAGD